MNQRLPATPGRIISSLAFGDRSDLRFAGAFSSVLGLTGGQKIVKGINRDAFESPRKSRPFSRSAVFSTVGEGLLVQTAGRENVIVPLLGKNFQDTGESVGGGRKGGNYVSRTTVSSGIQWA